MRRHEREARALPFDFQPTRDQHIALLQRMHNLRISLDKCRDKNRQLANRLAAALRLVPATTERAVSDAHPLPPSHATTND